MYFLEPLGDVNSLGTGIRTLRAFGALVGTLLLLKLAVEPPGLLGVFVYHCIVINLEDA